MNAANKKEERAAETANPPAGHSLRRRTPREVLMGEHRVIETALDAAERMLKAERVDGDFLRNALDFFRNFADGCHHAKEEDAYFPELEAAGVPREGGPVGCMLFEHEHGRILLRRVDDNLAAAVEGDAGAVAAVNNALRDYIFMLREHIKKEDNILFELGEKLLSAETKDELMRKFHGTEQKDAGKHERYEKLAEKLSSWTFGE